MKFLLAVLLVASALTAGASTLGPDVAVFEIRIGKEKQTQRVVIGLYDQAAPVTVANFKDLVSRRYYRGMRFHRVLPGALVQTGDPLSRRGRADRSGTGGPGYTIPAEIRLPIRKGSVVTARLADTINPARNSNGSQFFAALQPLPKLDGKYTVFGEVLEGLDVLDYISNLPTDSNDFPLQKVVIKSITLEPRVAPSSEEQQ
ncbi:MAG: peptidylprolyl isomerase [Terrimicrobiaceae bacterium]|nr:peptidylprolyl isomerase [Terrimicrobiaceae bacterium]